jgi:hypothetical protein
MPLFMIITLLLALPLYASEGVVQNSATAPDGRPLAALSLPWRGMTQQQVERQFGPPLERRAAVGQPPISRWIYREFSVYFESHWVIHAVVNRPEGPQRHD